ncbi:hypothetical protein [Anaerotignum sp.]|uniref:hypothetical protein n=1 Tax=Anaerotignum sp. TaxID=2039241 RepID=UPI0028AE26F7|nr:hypothetical protein [Anaerotignum sp.]
MQNPNVKYLKMPNGNFCLFYHENSTLLLRTYSNAGWSGPQIIAEHTTSTFSICKFGEICYILYSTMEGNLFMASSMDFVNWDHRPMMGGAPNSGKTKFFMIPNEDTFHVIYHLPTESTGIDSLVYTAFRNGQWEKPYQIDRFMPFGKTTFLARRLSKEHIILYYRTSRNIWSAREMLLSPYTMGSLTPMIQSPSNYIDISIVNDAERIHVLYIVRGMFRTQVVYQYKQTTAISTPRVLWEDSNCDNCLAFLEEGKLVLMWTVNGQPLRCTSENNGATFGAVERYTGNFPAQCTKGEFIGADEAQLNATETYGDMSRNYHPFLVLNKSSVKPQPQPQPQQQTLHFQKGEQPQSIHFQPEKQALHFNQEVQPQPIHFSQEVPPQSKVAKAYVPPQDMQKQQMEELSALLAQRSDEIASVNARWKAQVSRMESELASLKKENEQLRQAQISHQAQLQQLQNQENKKIQIAENTFHQAQEFEAGEATPVEENLNSQE